MDNIVCIEALEEAIEKPPPGYSTPIKARSSRAKPLPGC